ncbi:MAG TPA: nickel pincer cofactor biosynthesis protein LarC [Motilibacteraceae bacterium]|nr:nickel pincer cofactor biosynthesis protein LarC [Motilibacteraceae bacterium]
MSTIGWLDAGSGASGDMLLGALADLAAGTGRPLPTPADAVDALRLPGVSTRTERVTRSGLAATYVLVDSPGSQPLRTLPEITAVLEGSDAPSEVRTRALAAFGRIADAEAAVHGVAREQVHFHEVGAVDTLVDVLGACWGLHELGLDALHCTPVALGGGTVRAAHGRLPVPVPAVLQLLQGVPTHGGPVDVELCTPTGAALLAEHVTAWGPMPPMAVTAVGTGAGGRDLPDHPNVLRLVVGETTDSQERQQALVIECTVDDLDPRIWPGVLTALLDAGASDAWLTATLGKKGRPGHLLSVLTMTEHADAVRRTVLTHTSTLGLREHPVAKTALARCAVTVDVDGRPVAVKLGVLDGLVVNAQPEWEDVAAAATALGRPAKVVLAAAVAAAHDAAPVGQAPPETATEIR